MEGLENFSLLNDEEYKKDQELLKKSVLETLEKNDEYKSYFNSILKTDEEFNDALPWIYRILEDLKKCEGCTSFSKCPKENKGYRLELIKVGVKNDYSVKRYICEKRKKIIPYLNNIVTTDVDPLTFFDSIGKFSSLNFKNGRTPFFKAAGYIASTCSNYLKSKCSDGIILYCKNRNKDFLARLIAYYGISKNLRISFLEGSKSLVGLNNDEFLSLMGKLNRSDIIVLNNIQNAKFSYDFIVDQLPKILSLAFEENHILLITSNKPVADYLPNYKVSSKITKMLEQYNKFEIDDPLLF